MSALDWSPTVTTLPVPQSSQHTQLHTCIPDLNTHSIDVKLYSANHNSSKIHQIAHHTKNFWITLLLRKSRDVRHLHLPQLTTWFSAVISNSCFLTNPFIPMPYDLYMYFRFVHFYAFCSFTLNHIQIMFYHMLLSHVFVYILCNLKLLEVVYIHPMMAKTDGRNM